MGIGKGLRGFCGGVLGLFLYNVTIAFVTTLFVSSLLALRGLTFGLKVRA